MAITADDVSLEDVVPIDLYFAAVEGEQTDARWVRPSCLTPAHLIQLLVMVSGLLLRI